MSTTFEIDYLALASELIIAGTLLAVLTLDLFLARPQKYWTATVAVAGTALALLPLGVLAINGETVSMFDGSYVVDEFALVLKGLFLVAGYIVFLMSHNYIESERYYQGEYYLLLLASLLGSLVMASSRDLIILFIGLELTTGPLYMLTGWRKGDVKSNEASMKYFILGVLSTAILLYGMSLLFGLTGEVSFAGIAEATAGLLSDEPALVMAILFLMVGFGFKVSAVPFHFWAPDTYEGAPTPVTAYLSVNSKAAGFVALLIVMYQALPQASDIWAPALWLLAALSMTIGNLSALRQTNIVRLLAYSSIAQAGFMLVPFAAAAVAGADLESAFGATLIYLVIYAVMNLGAFGVVIAGARKTRSGEIDRWAGLARVDPILGVLTGVFFFSLAGIPPLAGWFAKFEMFRSVMIADPATIALAVIAAVNSVIALYYYARVIKSVWLDEPAGDFADEAETAPAGSLRLALGVSVALTFAIGVYPSIASFVRDAAQVLASGG